MACHGFHYQSVPAPVSSIVVGWRYRVIIAESTRNRGAWDMQNLLSRILVYLKTSHASDSAQDTVEYALVIGVMAFGAVAGTQSLASGISTAMNGVSSALAASFH
jgi:Flp pilus assembly pilin Flp